MLYQFYMDYQRMLDFLFIYRYQSMGYLIVNFPYFYF